MLGFKLSFKCPLLVLIFLLSPVYSSCFSSHPFNRAGCPFPLSLFCNPVKLKLIRLLLIPAQLNNSIYWLPFTYGINGRATIYIEQQHIPTVFVVIYDSMWIVLIQLWQFPVTVLFRAVFHIHWVGVNRLVVSFLSQKKKKRWNLVLMYYKISKKINI